MRGLLSCILLAAVGVSESLAPPRDGKKNSDPGFHAGSQYRTEKKGADGLTRGEYGYRTPDGCLHVVIYEANDQGGYRVLGSTKRDCQFVVTRPPRIPPPSTTRRPTTTTRRPTTTIRRPTTTKRPTTIWQPTTSANFKPSDPFLVPEVKIVNNAIVGRPRPAPQEEDSQGRQLSFPNLIATTTRRPTTTTTTAAPAGEEPIYSYGYTTPTHGHTESSHADGSKKGEYYWDAPDGWRYIVAYEANARGFYPRMRRVRIDPTTTTPKPPPQLDNKDRTGLGKELDEGALPKPAGGCPYYFYYNTRINYHWERCFENHTKVGEYGYLGPDGYQHKNAYHADITGYHPKLSKIPLNARQLETVAEYQEGAFIVPKPDEERQKTEKRILAWLADNRNKIEEPLR